MKRLQKLTSNGFLYSKCDGKVDIVLPDCFVFVGGNILLFLK
jgi:hypothetical protein